MMGVRRNAISLVAQALQRAGIIRYSRGRIEITNLRALEATSCDCYAAVKARCGRLLEPASLTPVCTHRGGVRRWGRDT